MKQTKLFFSLGVLFFFFGITVYGQQSLIPAGGEASGSGGSVSYTTGQVFSATYKSASGVVSEGVQQPYEIFVVTAIEEAKGIKLYAKAFPNPTSDLLKLEVDVEIPENLSFRLYNLNGNLIKSEKITSYTTEITMHGLDAGVYLLSVIDQKEKVFKTFRIIKK